jgi:hypothetical protein
MIISVSSAKRAIGAIEASGDAALKKVRRLLRLVHDLEKGACVTARLGFGLLHSAERATGVRFINASNRLMELAHEVRGTARRILGSSEGKLGFGYGPQTNAYPRWSNSGRTGENEASA